MILFRLGAAFALALSAALASAPEALAQAAAPAAVADAPRTYTIFMHLRTRDAWLRLSREDRLQYMGRHILPALQRYPAVKMRHFDAESYTARLSDVVVFETTDLRQYDFLVDVLRDLEFWHTYFDVLEVIPTVEAGFVDFNRTHGVRVQ